MDRDKAFAEAVSAAKIKHYGTARTILHTILQKHPDDIDALLLFSIVSENRERSIVALKRILLLDPDHEVAFKQLSRLKHAPPSSIPSPIPPLPIPIPTIVPRSSTEAKTRPREKITINPDRTLGSKRKKRSLLDTLLVGLLVLACLVISYAGIRAIVTFLVAGT